MKASGKAKYPCGYEIEMEVKSIFPWTRLNLSMPSKCPIHGYKCPNELSPLEVALE